MWNLLNDGGMGEWETRCDKGSVSTPRRSLSWGISAQAWGLRSLGLCGCVFQRLQVIQKTTPSAFHCSCNCFRGQSPAQASVRCEITHQEIGNEARHSQLWRRNPRRSALSGGILSQASSKVSLIWWNSQPPLSLGRACADRSACEDLSLEKPSIHK